MNRICLCMLLAVGGASAIGCGERAGDAGRAPSVEAAAPVAADSTTFTERVVVLLLATDATLDSLRQERSPEDFAVIADDMMFYRAAARELIEQRGLPSRAFHGRHTLRFMVGGAMQSYDFADVTWLDVVVLYEPGREPRVMAPIEFPLVLDEYLGAPPTGP